MIQTMQSELFRIRKNRLFWVCLALAAFFVFALALTFYHNSVDAMLPAISLVSFTEFLFSDYSLIFPLTLFLCLYFTEDFHTGTYSIALSKGTSRVHLFFGKLLASWIGVLFFLFVCFGVAYLSILIMGASRYDIDYFCNRSLSSASMSVLFRVHRISQSAKLPSPASDNCNDCRIFSAGGFVSIPHKDKHSIGYGLFALQVLGGRAFP